MDINDAIEIISKEVQDPKKGLPQEIFYFISRVTPMVNVDLLIKDEKGRVLLAWRDDKHAGKGWHIPGGIVRFKENFETRIKKVAESEIGVEVKFDPNPITVSQMINDKCDVRGHFISFLYKCSLSSSFVPKNKELKESDPGFLKWHETCPDNLLEFHKIYYGKYL